MKILKPSFKLFAAAFALLILTNIVVLLGIYLNRSGDTTSEAILTQRELEVPYYMDKENNSISLKIVYRNINKVNNSYYNNYNDWLDLIKLKELGFDTDKYLTSKKNANKPTKEVFVVLEYNGESYKNSLKLAEETFAKKEALYNADKSKQRAYKSAKNGLTREQTSASRLFAIDAGLDYDVLRQKYTNKANFIIVKGLVKIYIEYKKKIIYGYIQQLHIQNIHLPYEFKHLLKNVEPIDKYNEEQNTYPSYKVGVKYGSSFEPWITSLKYIN
ncbi:DUF4824 family protein [Sulfurimonas sp.]|uniref:DUF4824 family protein n=1 Tax=Sulfurimonas sp. TaxID=2022749 RepID=UPI002B45A36F|nr:DUF4824 family protein [Sulfurimonas sp.]